jgi:hypothetical protein
MAALIAGGGRGGAGGDGGGYVVIDEYTSLVDRRSARLVSEKMAEFISDNEVTGVVLASVLESQFLILTSLNSY